MPTADLRRSAARPLLLLCLAGAAMSAQAQGRSCDELRDEIAQKFRNGGVPQADLRIVEAGAPAPGRVVGQCAQGSRRIVYVAGSAARPAEEPLLTECKDGTSSVGGNCGRSR